MSPNSIGFVIPCLNEEMTVATVVADCKKALPGAVVYVFDNKSTDQTALKAAQAGATVIPSPRPGKGEVIRHAFSVLDKDILVMLDGDGTYDAQLAAAMTDLVSQEHADMVVCIRKAPSDGAYPRFHRLGNQMFSAFVSVLLGKKISDVFSGFRAVSREFYESVFIESKGFEVESEMTLKAVSHGYRIREIGGEYRERPAGSYSKLRTFKDGFFILKFIFLIIKDCRPLAFFSFASLVCMILSALSGLAPIQDYMEYKYVHTVPRAILAASLMVMAMLFFGIGLILDSQIRNLREQSQLLRRWVRNKRLP
jgi:glycosyltransferase involved in cell wall biosynthesis